MYNALKTDLATFLGISKDALHIHTGLALFSDWCFSCGVLLESAAMARRARVRTRE